MGAAYDYGILWSTLLVAPMAVAVQEMAARLGLVTGHGLGTLIRNRYPRWVLLGCVALVALANTFNIAADLASMGASAHLVVPLPPELLTVVMGAGMLALEVFLSYRRYATVLRFLALSLLAYVLVLFTISIDWSAVLHGFLVPNLDGGKAELAALIAVFGTTVSPYLFFWQASEEVEEEGEEHNEPDPHRQVTGEHLTAMRVDVAGGMVSAVGIASAIIIATAATLHARGVTDIATADQAARALRPLAGDLAGLLFATGIVGLGLLAVPVLAGATAFAVSEAMAHNEGLSRSFRDARGFYIVIIGSMLLGLTLDFAGLDPIRGLYYAAILNGVTAPPLILVMLLLARSHRTLGDRRSGWLSTTVVVLTIVAGTALPIAYLVS